MTNVEDDCESDFSRISGKNEDYNTYDCKFSGHSERQSRDGGLKPGHRSITGDRTFCPGTPSKLGTVFRSL